jgi:hypothetical protein
MSDDQPLEPEPTDDTQPEEDALEDDEARPDRRSDAKDPWHALDDFDE